MLRKKILVPVIVATIGGASLFGLNHVVRAQDATVPYSGLVETLAQKFGLDKAQVQTVIEEYHKDNHQKMEQKMQERMEDKLNQAVKDGKLTEDQKKALLEKLSSLHEEKDSEEFNNMTPEERRKEMEKAHDELESWAKEQGIDLTDLMVFKMGMHKGAFFMLKTQSPAQ
ncbi:MAG: hypothetical protein HYV40_00930 [Candidatus Levybacteria bacterium]|nr:hypothetical protein [Candidatus Levybacteria bacterium]